jgi:phosphoribosyl-ATP pyrophosphohydrolase
VTFAKRKENKMGLTEKSFLERWAEMGITPTKRDINVNFTEEDFEIILAFQQQEGQNTVQEAIMDAVRACLKD